MADPIRTLADQATEEELRSRARELGGKVIERAEHLIMYGSPQAQLAIIRALIPPMLYTVKDTGEGDRKRAAMRTELEGLMKAVRESDEFEGPDGAAVDPDESR